MAPTRAMTKPIQPTDGETTSIQLATIRAVPATQSGQATCCRCMTSLSTGLREFTAIVSERGRCCTALAKILRLRGREGKRGAGAPREARGTRGGTLASGHGKAPALPPDL